MKTITTSAQLKTAIQELELEQKNNFLALKEELGKAQENFKITNIIKNAFKAVVDVPDLKADIMNATIGVASGIMTKKLVMGKNHNPVTKLLGIVMEMFVANKVTQNADLIRTAGSMILNKFFKKKEQAEKV